VSVPLSEPIKQAMQSGMTALCASASLDGIPNAAVISQVYFVDDHHVALSFQFFNKTVRNVRENPQVCVILTDTVGLCHWRMQLRYLRSETEGDTFDEMEMQLEAIASATGMAGIFKLRAADVYEVLSYERMAPTPVE